MARPSKLTHDIKQRISDNIALGLTYILAASVAGITSKTLNSWISKGKTEKSGKYFQFYRYIQKRNAAAVKTLLERRNDAAKAGNCQVCIWILDRRFPGEFGRRVYRKTNVVSENKNVNVEINVNDVDEIRNKILDKLV